MQHERSRGPSGQYLNFDLPQLGLARVPTWACAAQLLMMKKEKKKEQFF